MSKVAARFSMVAALTVVLAAASSHAADSRPSAATKPATTLDPAAAARLIETVTARRTAFLRTYKGYSSARHHDFRTFHADTGKPKGSAVAKLRITATFDSAKPVQVISSCVKDGKRADDPDDCQPRKRFPGLIPIFGPDGKRAYKLVAMAASTVEKRPTWRFKVVPRKDSERHFKGVVHIDQHTKRIKMLEGTRADLSFPVKAWRLRAFFVDLPEGEIPAYGTVNFHGKIPLIFEIKARLRFKSSKHKLIRR